MFDVSSDVAPNIVQKTEEELGFIVKKHDIIFNGICRDCLEKSRKVIRIAAKLLKKGDKYGQVCMHSMRICLRSGRK